MNDIKNLRAEFDNFTKDGCSLDADGNLVGNRDARDDADEEPVLQFVDALTSKLLAPQISGVYLSRLDIKRVAEAIGESLPIKERAKMLKTLFRHTTKKQYLIDAFAEINRHINGRIMIYMELGEAFPASKYIFDDYIIKAKKSMKMFDQIVDDFEEIGPSDDPIYI